MVSNRDGEVCAVFAAGLDVGLFSSHRIHLTRLGHSPGENIVRGLGALPRTNRSYLINIRMTCVGA